MINKHGVAVIESEVSGYDVIRNNNVCRRISDS